jgi:CubicO group peptidase (beta-lactamase class C family)
VNASPIDRLLEGASGVRFTGAAARVERRGVPLYERAWGATRADEAARPVYVDTAFDLASLTKLFIATLALGAVARAELTLDEPLARWIPAWTRGDHARITLRMLLSHTSGMHSGADYRTLLDCDVAAFALERPLRQAPGSGVIYSDLGMIALGVLLERLRGRSLTAQIAALGRPGLRFNPPARDARAIVATEDDGWRGRVQGVVHDEKAFLMNGVAGHAGLFGSAADVAWLTGAYLAAACGREQHLLPDALARDAIACAADDPVLRRGWGWALRTTAENSCGTQFGPHSFGHTGFTGTCVWADPDRDLQAVLLTNAVYFGRTDSRPLRAAFYDAVIETYG